MMVKVEMMTNQPKRRPEARLFMVKIIIKDILYKADFLITGVNMDKWNRAKKAKPEAVTALNAASSIDEFVRREAVYEAHRDEITAEFK